MDIKAILITGGTGSFGRAFVRRALKTLPSLERLVIFSRDELKQYEMSQDPDFQDGRLRFFLGDVRDVDRLRRAMEGVDTVVHAAALKQVMAAEYNPFEAIKTNVLGAQNVIEACLDHDVRHVVALSTDKAAAPINLYGATKLCSDKLFIAANNFKGRRQVRFSAVRYGNVLGSRGSVVPLFLRLAKTGVLPITHPEMTRFNITLPEGADFVLSALRDQLGGELYIPKIPSFRILDLATAIAPGCEHRIVGVRPGEKVHEEMITPTDSLNCVEFDRHYVMLPGGPDWDLPAYAASRGGKACTPGFHYESGKNTRWLSVDELRSLIREHIDPAFSPWTGPRG